MATRKRRKADGGKRAKHPAPKPRKKKTATAKPTKKKSGGAWAAALAPRASDEKRYWLVKSEPNVFSFDDLLRRHNKTTQWDGIRNFVARNFLRHGMQRGDRVFFYHSSTGDPGVVGICEVVREAYPDGSQFDTTSAYYDTRATKEKPIWYMVDLRAVAQMTHPVPLTKIKATKELRNMALLRIGRLSVTPVTPAEWDVICAIADRLP
jgi:predicted RNA-binding protein with PUA-like domain